MRWGNAVVKQGSQGLNRRQAVIPAFCRSCSTALHLSVGVAHQVPLGRSRHFATFAADMLNMGRLQFPACYQSLLSSHLVSC